MDQREWLTEKFEGNRVHLRAVAYRMLGSFNEADDAVQEAWLRLNRSDTSGVENLGAGSRPWSRACAWTCCARASRGARNVILAPRGRLIRALNVTIAGDRIVQLEIIGDPARLRQLDLAVLG